MEMDKELPERIILTIGEIKRIGIFKEFCKSERFDEYGVVSRTHEDGLVSLDSKILPKDYSYEVPKGYTIKGFND
jgi:hypothetical protein